MALSSSSGGSRSPAVWRRDFLSIVMGLLYAVVFSSIALAQEATIVGTVTDSTGAAVPNAKITLTNTDTGSRARWRPAGAVGKSWL